MGVAPVVGSVQVTVTSEAVGVARIAVMFEGGSAAVGRQHVDEWEKAREKI